MSLHYMLQKKKQQNLENVSLSFAVLLPKINCKKLKLPSYISTSMNQDNLIIIIITCCFMILHDCMKVNV